MTDERLGALAPRIDRLVRAPEEVKAPLVRLVGPVLTAFGWQPRVKVDAARALAEALARSLAPLPPPPEKTRKAFEEALAEMERNVVAVERSCVLNRRPPVAYAAWLRRLHEFVSRAEAALPDEGGAPRDRFLARVAATPDLSAILPPLVVRAAAVSAADEAHADSAIARPAADAASRVVELQLASIDHLLDAARAEREVLARRRRLLEAARQLLLETAAAIPLDAAAVAARKTHIAAEIARIDRVQAAGVDAEVGLVHQARQAVARADTKLLHAALVAIHGAAAASGDLELGSRSARALDVLGGGEDPSSPEARALSREASSRELLGDRLVDLVNDGYARARDRAAEAARRAKDAQAMERARLAGAFFGPGGERATLAAALAVDGLFELGGAVTPVRLVEEERRFVAVRWPTQRLLLEPAREITDVPDAVLEDPRTVLLDLAAGKLLSRRFVREEVRHRTRTVLETEVRVYVLDGSGSMLGPRARMRDAILLSEIATLVRRLEEAHAAGDGRRVVLFYRYFTKRVGPTTRVDSIARAERAVADVLGDVREGGTDIEAALLASFDQIREARATEPDLARAQVVLVTDGDAPVDEARVRAARESLTGLPVGVSVVALGEENEALRGLVAQERARGERAFYHFVDDETLAAAERGDLDGGVAVHPRALLAHAGAGASRERIVQRLAGSVGPLVEELEEIGRARDVAAMEQLEVEEQARREVGLAEAVAWGESERGRREAIHKDRRALEHRFARWFPDPPSVAAAAGPPPPPGSPEREDLDAALVVLASIQDVLTLVGGSPLARQADALELVERLLPDARLTPERYAAVIGAWPGAVADALRAVRASAGLGG